MAIPLQGSTPNLQGGSVGQTAVNPTQNIPATPTVLPKAQVAPNDLSGTYANVGGTIYNTKSQTKFATPADFFKDSGVNSFDNLKFNTSYTPTGKETIYGQQVAPTVTPPPIANDLVAHNTNPNITSGAQVLNTVPTTLPQLATTNSTTTPATTYTPPNGGTTGVNQGGIIGNLITNAQNNPALDTAKTQLTNDQKNYQNALTGAATSSGLLGQLLGKQGQVTQNFGGILSADQTAVQNALSGQSNTTAGLSSAGGLNAPITNPQTGGLVTPSAPNTTGQTTSGAQNISSLIGQGNGSNGHPQGEFFNTQTGKGFSTPQELSDFINQQLGNPNATNASNVFQQLSSGALNSSGSNSALNPLTQIPSLVQSVIAGNMTYQDAVSRNGTVPNFSSALTAAIKQVDPNFDFVSSTASAAAKASNVQNQQTASTEAAKNLYLQQYPAAAGLYQAIKNVEDAGNLTIQNAQGQNINPFTVVPLNSTIADARRLFSSSGQAAFDSNITNLKQLVTSLNSQNGGTPTSATDNAVMLINDSTPMSTLKTLIDQAKQEGQLKFNNALGTGLKGWNDLQSGSSSGTSSSNPEGWF